MFSLVSNRYERASMIVTSNEPFSKWGEIFGDDMAATAMIDRLIHHSEILSLKGDSYRLRGKDLDTRIGANPPKSADPITLDRPAEGRRTPHNTPVRPPTPGRTRLKRPSPLRPRPTGSTFATTVACPQALRTQPSSGLVFDRP